LRGRAAYGARDWQWRPICTQDAAEAFKLAMESPDAMGGIFNVGCDEQNSPSARSPRRWLPTSRWQIEQGTNGGDPRSYRV
jgi:hypothetical protein